MVPESEAALAAGAEEQLERQAVVEVDAEEHVFVQVLAAGGLAVAAEAPSVPYAHGRVVQGLVAAQERQQVELVHAHGVHGQPLLERAVLVV